MSICNECWGKGWIEKQGVQFDCRKCKGKGVIENEPQTNEEWLRNLSFNEFARVLYCMIINGERIRPDLAYIKQWLKEKHDGE